MRLKRPLLIFLPVFLGLLSLPEARAGNACVWSSGGAWTTATWNTCGGTYPGANVGDTATINATGADVTISAMPANTLVSVSLSSNAILRMAATTFTITTISLSGTSQIVASAGLVLVCDKITVNDGTTITGAGQGYAGGQHGSCNGSGPGAGGCGAGGGGHGGAGGSTGIGSGGGTYDSAAQPTDYGSGGGGVDVDASTTAQGGAGGGYIKFIVAGTLTISGTGTISVNGANGQGPIVSGYFTYYGGGGAGGSLWVQASAVTGTATTPFQAIGGNGGGGGGGGRIAVYYSSVLSLSNQGDASTLTSGGSAAGSNGPNPGSPGSLLYTRVFDARLISGD